MISALFVFLGVACTSDVFVLQFFKATGEVHRMKIAKALIIGVYVHLTLYICSPFF